MPPPSQGQTFALEMNFGKASYCLFILCNVISGGERPKLWQFVNGRSFLLWEALGLDHSSLGWLNKSPQAWMQDENYLYLFNFVQNFTCVNDPSERIVQLTEKRIKTVRSEEMFQATLLTVHELNLLSYGLKRDRFKKSELQTIVTKLMAVS